MLGNTIRKLKETVFSFVQLIPGQKKEIPQESQSGVKTRKTLSERKRAELRALCQQLLKKREFIASGKLQFIGLESVREKMGKRWAGLRRVVYEVVESSIDHHIGEEDLYLLYEEDSYLIIFSQSSLEEGRRKVAAIADEVRRRLFTLDEEDLRKLELRESTGKIGVDSFLESDFPEMMDEQFQGGWAPPPVEETGPDKPVHIRVEAESVRESRLEPIPEILPQGMLNCAFMPVWEVKRSALTTYICLARADRKDKSIYDAHKDFYARRPPIEKLRLDIGVLETVMQELESMEREERKFFVMCPVQHETLHSFEMYEKYKEACEKIPERHRPYLIFLVMVGDENKLPVKDSYWFVQPLKKYGCFVFAEIPMRQDINFQYLKNAGVDAVGVRFNSRSRSEQEIIGTLNAFSPKAKYFKIPKTFAFDVATLSATTSLVCAGFDYLGGLAIHDEVKQPDTIHRYRYEDLLADMVPSIPPQGE